MPVPKPRVNETRQKFISRFMSDKKMKEEFPNNEQRLAVANSTWEKIKKGGDGLPSSEYLAAFLEKAKEFLPDWMVKKIHSAALPSAGGKARYNRLCKGVVSFQDLPLVDRNREWDSEQAIDNIRSWAADGEVNKENIDWEEYRKAFLWYDSENAENFSAYKMPIADVIDGRLRAVPRGIFAAAAVLEGARGGVDVPSSDQEEMKNHLTRYYNKMAEEFEDESIKAPFEKSSHKEEEMTKKIIKQDEEKRLVYGIVLEPETVDAQGDIISKEEIEEAAHFFMENSQTIGKGHYMEAPAIPVQSYICPCDCIIGKNQVKEGSWILVVKIIDDDLWVEVKKGEYTGFSLGGFGKVKED